MIIDGHFRFATTPQALSGTTDVNSTNVHDAGSAKLLFGGLSQRPPDLVLTFTAVSGTLTSVRGRFVGADDAALATNPLIILDTGAITVDDLGAAWAAAGRAVRRMPMIGQTVAKRYYGVIWTQAGTTPVWNVQAYVTPDAQSRDFVPKAAVP